MSEDSLTLYTVVKAVNDRFFDKNVQKGREGLLIEDYGDGHYEVDFSTDTEDLIFLTVKRADIEPVV